MTTSYFARTTRRALARLHCYIAAMKTNAALLLTALAAAAFLSACEKQTIGTRIDDAMDNRPAEKLQDKVEDVRDAVKK
jgi:hypothetical protein